MTTEPKTATRKIGQNRGKPRLWIEGKLLADAGLDHGERWNLVPISEGFLLQRDPNGSRKIAGKPGRPVIDIVGSSLGEIGKVAEVSLAYRPGFGLIVVAKTEEEALRNVA